MTTDMAAAPAGARVLPVLTLPEPATAAPPADALGAGGARCAEVTFRTPDAEQVLKAMAAHRGLTLGAGTVLTAEQAERAVAADAHFVVSPAHDEEVITKCREFIGSIVTTTGLPQRTQYSASKGAVLSLTLAMAADHIREGIRFNCANPGTVDTPWVGRLLDAAPDPAAERAALNAHQPTGRLITAEEVAAAIVYLASPATASITGTALAVDGGMAGLRLRPDEKP